MKCKVSACKNTSNSTGITFHTFPREKALQYAWIQALDKNNISWKGALCSEHFPYEDLLREHGLVKEDVDPLAITVKWENVEPLPCLEACRVCLVTGVKMFDIFENDLQKYFTQLTMVVEKKGLPSWICFECVQCLLNCVKFKEKCLRANELILKVVREEGALTFRNIQKINRKKHLLTSNLSIKHFDVNHFDFSINMEEEEDIEEFRRSSVEDIEENNTIEYLDEDKDQIAEYLEGNIDISDDTDDFLPTEIINEKDVDFIPDENYLSDDKELKKRKSTKNKKNPTIDDLSDYFTHQKLSVEEQKAVLERRKEASNYKDWSYKCPDCYRGYLNADAYNAHRVRHTDVWGAFECSICKMHCSSQANLRTHRHRHENLFTCKKCSFRTLERRIARQHMAEHKGEKKTFQCPHCGETFNRSRRLFYHISVKHPSDVICRLCGYSFLNRNGLAHHTNMKHRGQDLAIPEDGPLCELCSIRFVDEAALNQHLKVSPKHNDSATRVRNEPKALSEHSNVCGPRAKRRRNTDKSLKKRPVTCEQINTGPRPYKCDTCDETFVTPSERRVHAAHAHRDMSWRRGRNKKVVTIIKKLPKIVMDI